MIRSIETMPSEESDEQTPEQIEFQDAMKKIEKSGESNPKAITSERVEEEKKSDKKDKSHESVEDAKDELMDKSQEMEEKWNEIFSDITEIGKLLGDRGSRDLIEKFTEKISGNSKEKFSGSQDELTLGGGEADTRTAIDKFLEKANEGTADMSEITRATSEMRRLVAELKKAHEEEFVHKARTKGAYSREGAERADRAGMALGEKELKDIETAEKMIEELEKKVPDLSKCARDINKIVRRIERGQ
jgi:methyl-accepting chemotaxis protein